MKVFYSIKKNVKEINRQYFCDKINNFNGSALQLSKFGIRNLLRWLEKFVFLTTPIAQHQYRLSV